MIAGCGGGSGDVRSKETSHIRAITSLYAKSVSILGRNPANEQELKEVIAQSDVNLAVFGVASSDELLISERDGQPLVIVYGQSPKGVAPGVITYEQVGVDGSRQVGFKIGQIEDADAARFAELVPAPPKP